MNNARRTVVDKSTQPVGVGKRTIAFIMDICCVFLCSALLYSYVVPSIRKACYDLTPTITAYQERLVLTGLYEQKSEEDDTYYPLNRLYEDPYKLLDDKKEQYIQTLETKIVAYYNNTENFPNANIEEYYDLQEEHEEVWEYVTPSDSTEPTESTESTESAGSYIKKESATLDDQLKFFLLACDTALSSLKNDTELAKYASTIQRTQMIELLSCISLTLLIFELLIPMILKKRQTIGKYVSAITIVNPKDNMPISRPRYLLRFAILFLEVISSIFTYGIPLLVSFTVMCFNKKRYALHDFAAQSKIIPVDKIGEKELPDDTEETLIAETK